MNTVVRSGKCIIYRSGVGGVGDSIHLVKVLDLCLGVQAAWEIMCQDSNKHRCEVWGWYVVDDCGLVPVDGMVGGHHMFCCS